MELEPGALGFFPKKQREKNSSGVSIFVSKVKRVATKNTYKNDKLQGPSLGKFTNQSINPL